MSYCEVLDKLRLGTLKPEIDLMDKFGSYMFYPWIFCMRIGLHMSLGIVDMYDFVNTSSRGP